MKRALVCVCLVLLALYSWGCAVGWQINMPASYGQCHSRGTSYAAAGAKAMDVSGTSEAFQQQRATTGTGDALTSRADQAKATDLASAKGQAVQTTETAKAQEQGTASNTGAQGVTASPTKTTSIAPQANIAPGGLAVGAQTAPAASPGTNTAAAAAQPQAAPQAATKANYDHVATGVSKNADGTVTATWDGGTVTGKATGGFQPTDGAAGMTYIVAPATGDPVRLLLTPAMVDSLK